MQTLEFTDKHLLELKVNSVNHLLQFSFLSALSTTWNQHAVSLQSNCWIFDEVLAGPARGYRDWGGRNKFWGSTRSLIMWIWEGHGGTSNLSQSESYEQGDHQKKKKGLHWNSEGFFGRNQKFKRFFRPKICDLQKKRVLQPKIFVKSGVSPQKLRICGAKHQFGPRFALQKPRSCWFLRGTVLAEGAQFSFWGAQALIWGARPRNAPRGAGPEYWSLKW